MCPDNESLVDKVQKMIDTDASLLTRLSEKPLPPEPDQCCGSDCAACVNDLYQHDLEQWALQCMRTLQPRQYAAQPDSDAPSAMSPAQYCKFELLDVLPQTPDALLLRFNVPQDQLLRIPIGAHVIFRGVPRKGFSVSRPFTPVDCSGDHFDFLIKLYEDGKMSSYLRTLRKGDSVEMRGPFGMFHFDLNELSDILMICAGTGITPMIRIIDKVLSDEKSDSKIRLLFACHSYEAIYLKSRLDNWQRHWNFRVCYFINEWRQCGAKVRYGDEVKRQRLDSTCVSEELSKLNAAPNALVLVCGSQLFQKEVISCVKTFGSLAKRFFKF